MKSPFCTVLLPIEDTSSLFTSLMTRKQCRDQGARQGCGRTWSEADEWLQASSSFLCVSAICRPYFRCRMAESRPFI